MRRYIFAGGTAVITGAASGIGRAIAYALAQRNINLVLADIRDFALVDELYVKWLPDDRTVCHPSRTVFQAAALPAGALVMLDVIATYPS